MSTFIVFLFCAVGSAVLCTGGALVVWWVHNGPMEALWGVLMAAMLGFGGGGGFGVALIRLKEALQARAQARAAAVPGIVAASHNLALLPPILRALSGLGAVLFVLVVEIVLLIAL